MSDVDGRTFVIEETLDLADWWSTVQEADERFIREPSALIAEAIKALGREHAAVRKELEAARTGGTTRCSAVRRAVSCVRSCDPSLPG
jgi:hypothetical protein